MAANSISFEEELDIKASMTFFKIDNVSQVLFSGNLIFPKNVGIGNNSNFFLNANPTTT